jgi:hypothetical protein
MTMDGGTRECKNIYFFLYINGYKKKIYTHIYIYTFMYTIYKPRKKKILGMNGR